jgi:succinyl-diaminopimelate desuccinylase
VNTIPGTEVQYLDCRILPKYDLDNVVDFIDSQIREFQRGSKATITYEFVQREQAPLPTRMDAPVVVELKRAIKDLRGTDPSAVGIGGGTCAAFFRRKGYNAVVWSTTVPEVAHQADEYVHISHVLKDRDVILKIVYKN